METTNEGRAEKAFKNFGKKVDEFLADLDETGEKFQKDFNEKYEGLEKYQQEKLKKESENHRIAGRKSRKILEGLVKS